MIKMGRHPNIMLCIENIPQQEIWEKVNQFLEISNSLVLGLINKANVSIDEDISNSKEYDGISYEEAVAIIKKNFDENTSCKSLYFFKTLGGLKGLEDMYLLTTKTEKSK